MMVKNTTTTTVAGRTTRKKLKERSVNMKIEFYKGIGISLGFPAEEFKAALSVLKALYSVSKLSFIKEAIDDLEAELKPKALPLINYYHICSSCFRSIDEIDENTLHIVEKSHNIWRCRTCKPLNENRPQ